MGCFYNSAKLHPSDEIRCFCDLPVWKVSLSSVVQQIENKKNIAWNDSWADDTPNPNRLQMALKFQRTCKQAAFNNIIQKQNVHRHAYQTNADSFKEPQHDMHLKSDKGSVSVNQIISQF